MDISTCKSLAMVVRYFNGFRVNDEFLNLIQIKDGTSSTILKVIMAFFKSHNIPENNMIGFAADNCNVMMGVHDGVPKKLKEIIPKLFVLGCVCHSMHLCASAACMELPSTIEDSARDIYLQQTARKVQGFSSVSRCVTTHNSKIESNEVAISRKCCQ
ncbi:hypothetical protein JTB14_018435 [Gonioctena quinquepunctata]|nr:hypothetical protein JTB14_018435 [Gonioctena quinquepunctata]